MIRPEATVGLLHIVQDVTEIAYLEQAVTQQRNELLLARDQLTQQNAAIGGLEC